MSIFSFGRIYADWAATTPIHKKVLRDMQKARNFWANPSAIYKEGVSSKKFIENCREQVARLISAKPDEVFFTASGTEANALIINGVIESFLASGKKIEQAHVVSSSIEHSSVLETLRVWEGKGLKVTYVSPESNGIVSADKVLGAIQHGGVAGDSVAVSAAQTILVTCMFANNEIGTIQPISKIGAGIRKIRSQSAGMIFPIFHSDASQAPLWLFCDIEGLRADAITLDGHKIQGPKGVGALIARRHVLFAPFMFGGGQERGKRPGTESAVLIAGFTSALKIAHDGREKRSEKARKMQKFFFQLVKENLPDVVINGSEEHRLPNNINISLPNITDPEMAVLKLDHAGIACSTKSSCLKGEEESYVIKAIADKGKAVTSEVWRARNTLRFSFDPKISQRQVKKIVDTIALKVYNI